MSPPGAVAPGLDGLMRCPWALSSPDYTAYHDDEWGQEVRGETALFERLSLEAFQSGLSWLTILRKREAFRRAFDGFDPVVVAAYDDADVTRLLGDVGIVRNRAKIEATIANAAVVLGMKGGLSELLWSFAAHTGEEQPEAPESVAEVPAVTTASTSMAGTLRALGFRYVGPTTAYALMQATGMVDDHLASCFRRSPAGATA